MASKRYPYDDDHTNITKHFLAEAEDCWLRNKHQAEHYQGSEVCVSDTDKTIFGKKGWKLLMVFEVKHCDVETYRDAFAQRCWLRSLNNYGLRKTYNNLMWYVEHGVSAYVVGVLPDGKHAVRELSSTVFTILERDDFNDWIEQCSINTYTYLIPHSDIQVEVKPNPHPLKGKL